MVQVDYIMGLDLGQSKDYSALAILERRITPGHMRDDPSVNDYVVRFLQRWPLHTMFTKVSKDVCTFTERPPLAWPILGIDKTGVGAGPVEMIQEAHPAALIHPVLITAGHQVTHDGLAWHVPKKELVSTTVTLSQSNRLVIADLQISEDSSVTRDDVIRELQNFRIKITTAKNETFEAWREGQHDDLVLSIAIACWLGERIKPYKMLDLEDDERPRGHRAMDQLMARESRADVRGLFGRRPGR